MHPIYSMLGHHANPKKKTLRTSGQNESTLLSPKMLINLFLLICLALADAQRFTVQLHAGLDNVDSIRREQNAFLDQLQQADIDFTVRYQFTHVMNALSIQINNQTRASTPYHSFLARQPLVQRYWPGKRYPRPQSRHQHTGIPNLGSAHAMTGVHNISWTGEGIKVAILDTGVDYTHPALGGCFGVRFTAH